MTLLYGTAIAASLCLLMIMAGYGVAGILAAESRLTRLAVANLTGLAWLLFGASVMGALVPLRGPSLWLLWLPVLVVWLFPTTRNQLRADLQLSAQSSHFYAAFGGLALLWLALLSPYAVYPDLVFFDGKTNHDNFFWCVGAEYLQGNNYLTVPTQNRDFPLFNIVKAFTGWHPVWGRMGSEGFLAVASGLVGRSPIQLYNFAVGSLILPWLLTVLAIARRMGLPSLHRGWLSLICFCQPVLFFFIANGNLPNLLGAILGGGLWLIALLSSDDRQRGWPLIIAGIFLTHGILCCYPEILACALIPVFVLALWHYLAARPSRTTPFLWLTLIVLGGLCLNPLTTVRTWNGMINSIDQARQDANWANVFGRLTFAGYVPSLITLAMPTVRLIGWAGGAVASFCVLVSFGRLIKASPRRIHLLISLAGFGVMLAYTVATSFSYGWQKSVQFSAINLAVLFPVLLAGQLQSLRGISRRLSLNQVALGGTLLVLILGMLGNAADNLKSAGTKGITRASLEWREQVAAKFPHQTVAVDGTTFHAAFFHRMWSAELFARNPVTFLSHHDQAAGYLTETSALTDALSPVENGLYYVATDWARAFDYAPVPVLGDRVGVLLQQHNLTENPVGFYRTTGFPEGVAAEFSLAIFPYADGWIEFTLGANGPVGSNCQLRGRVTTDAGDTEVTATLDAARQLIARFPLKAGRRNQLSATITGAPQSDPTHDERPYAFKILAVQSARTP